MRSAGGGSGRVSRRAVDRARTAHSRDHRSCRPGRPRLRGPGPELSRNRRRPFSIDISRRIGRNWRGCSTQLQHRGLRLDRARACQGLCRAEAGCRTPKQTSRLRRLFARRAHRAAAAAAIETAVGRDRRIVSEWRKKSGSAGNRLEQACFDALHRIATAVMSRRGRLFGDNALLTELAVTLVCNDYGSEVIGDAIVPYCPGSGRARRLPPIAAAGEAGRHERQGRLGLRQEHDAAAAENPGAASSICRGTKFALISPDIWRKFLLDYGSLGAAYKYAGTLSGHEVEIIDKKLDRRMAVRADRGEMPHLLIDRFRFDSFVPESEGRGSKPAADAVRRSGLHVLHDHAAGNDGRARLDARAAGRPLQGGRRSAGAQCRSLYRHARIVLHLGAVEPESASTTSFSTTASRKAARRAPWRSAGTAR